MHSESGIRQKDPSTVAASKLIEDLIDFSKRKNKNSKYYLGGIIVLVDGEHSEEEIRGDRLVWELLDGQQRITSLTIIFNEIYRRLSGYEKLDPTLDEILYGWIEYDEERFGVDKEWTACLHPRRGEDRQYSECPPP